jgi:hypothetical protein
MERRRVVKFFNRSFHLPFQSGKGWINRTTLTIRTIARLGVIS